MRFMESSLLLSNAPKVQLWPPCSSGAGRVLIPLCDVCGQI